MTAKEKLAQKRLTLLQLAEKLGNVSKACLMHKGLAQPILMSTNARSRSTGSRA